MNLLDSILLSLLDYTEEQEGKKVRPFSRISSFKKFVLNVMGALLREDRYGVSSFIRSLGLSGDCYQNILHMFRSDAIDLNVLRHAWISAVKKHVMFFYSASEQKKDPGMRSVTLVIDHKKNSKEARHMPLVHRMRQESDTQSKAEFIFGHCWGAVGVLIGSADKLACLPLMTQIQDGLKGLTQWKEADVKDETMITRLYKNAIACAAHLQCNCRFLADRAFLSETGLKLIDEYNAASEYTLHVITKCRNTVVGYQEPEAPPVGKKGRPRKKGDSIWLVNLFKTRKKDFKQEVMTIYGEEKMVKYLMIDLLWKPGYYKKLRFVLSVIDGNLKHILVTDDLTLTAREVIEGYSVRFRIETMFRTMSQNGAFGYRFWTKAMKKLNRFAKSTDPDPLSRIRGKKKKKMILDCIKAIEMYMLVCGIATGLNQIISITVELDQSALRWQRTPAKKRPSEENITYALKNLFCAAIKTGFADCDSQILQIIREAQRHRSRTKTA